MKITHVLATVAFGALAAACQPPAASTSEAPATTETPATTEAPATTASAEAALPCGVLAQRNWEAQITTSGQSQTLTVAGEIDLPKPGYGVSLSRTDAAGVLSLSLRAPTGIGPEVETAHPVRYFGNIASAGRSIQITCDGAELTNIPVTN